MCEGDLVTNIRIKVIAGAAACVIAVLARPALGQIETCRLMTSFVDLKAKSASSNFLLSEFPLRFDDDEFTTGIRDPESGQTIYVGGQLINKGLGDESPVLLRMKVSLTGKSGDHFDSLDGPEAETVYNKDWTWLAISDEYRTPDRVYSFTFSCERRKKPRKR